VTLRRPLVLIAAILLLVPSVAAAQGATYALVVAGASGDPEYGKIHRAWVTSLTTTLRGRYKMEPTRLTVLVEEPQAGEDRATAENVRATIGKLGKQMTADDLLFVMLIGHGGGTTAEAKFNLVGPDLTVAEWNDLLKPLPGRLAFVNASSASSAFLKGLAGPNRVVITATDSQRQVYHPTFGGAFIEALSADIADTDKNGRLSLLEVFVYASRLVAEHYTQQGTLPNEHALFDDTGDGQGRDAAGTGKEKDGDVAALTYLDTVARPTSSDPEIQKLLDRQLALTQQIDDLRKRRQSMPAEKYEEEFEKLVTELAVVTAELKKRGK
jgi:hypothetical protein